MKLTNNRRGQGMVEYIIIVVVVGIFCIGIFMALGKSVQSQVGAATQKMVGSITHDAQLEDYGADGRVQAEKARENLMTHQ
jgi:Flp pilus assembly pilin Flp